MAQKWRDLSHTGITFTQRVLGANRWGSWIWVADISPLVLLTLHTILKQAFISLCILCTGGLSSVLLGAYPGCHPLCLKCVTRLAVGLDSGGLMAPLLWVSAFHALGAPGFTPVFSACPLMFSVCPWCYTAGLPLPSCLPGLPVCIPHTGVRESISLVARATLHCGCHHPCVAVRTGWPTHLLSIPERPREGKRCRQRFCY